jgi:hypothetical protein
MKVHDITETISVAISQGFSACDTRAVSGMCISFMLVVGKFFSN